MKRVALAAVAATLMATGAHAQTSGSYGGHTYTYHVTGADFATANANAAGKGGYLATVTSQGEQDFLHTLTNGVTTYLGGTDAGSEGLWHWIGGPEAGPTFYSTSNAPTDLTYSFWNPGEPNDFGGENALLINWDGNNGSWNDIAASAVYGYVVEFSGGAVPEPATWGMMILGFGAVGATLRRRSTKVAYA